MSRRRNYRALKVLLVGPAVACWTHFVPRKVKQNKKTKQNQPPPETSILRFWVSFKVHLQCHARAHTHTRTQEIWIIDASLSLTAPFPFFRHSSCSAIFRGCWQLWGIKVLNIVFVLAFLIKGHAVFRSTKYDSFSPSGGESSLNPRPRPHSLPSHPHLWITSSGGFFMELEPWQSMNHSCNNSCARVCRQPCWGMCKHLHTRSSFVLTTIVTRQRRRLIFPNCLMTCAILTDAFEIRALSSVPSPFAPLRQMKPRCMHAAWPSYVPALKQSLVLWCSQITWGS